MLDNIELNIDSCNLLRVNVFIINQYSSFNITIRLDKNEIKRLQEKLQEKLYLMERISESNVEVSLPEEESNKSWFARTIERISLLIKSKES